jgi:hypothetical protein
MILLSLQFLPIFYGKRWYCSWCGCGGLAETAEIVLDICLVKLKPHEKIELDDTHDISFSFVITCIVILLFIQ